VKPLIPDKELAAIQAAIKTTMPDTAVIQALTLTADGQGGFTEAWAAAGTVVCRLDNAGGGSETTGAALRSYSTWTLSVPVDADLTTDNRVVIGGYTYQVSNISDAPSWVGVQRAQVVRVE